MNNESPKIENILRQVENSYTDLKGLALYKSEKYFKHGLDMMYDQVIDILKSVYKNA